MWSPLLDAASSEPAAAYGWQEMALAASFLLGVIAAFFLLRSVDRKLRSRSQRQR